MTSQNSHVAEDLLCASYKKNEEHALGLHLVAEGVNTKSPWREQGVPQIPGASVSSSAEWEEGSLLYFPRIPGASGGTESLCNHYHAMQWVHIPGT